MGRGGRAAAPRIRPVSALLPRCCLLGARLGEGAIVITFAMTSEAVGRRDPPDY
jgi:hypothetical protein